MATSTKTATKKATPSKASSRSKTTPEQEPRLMKFFIDELKDIYWAEKHLAKALPKMKKAACTDELAEAIGMHLEETKEHAVRLEKIFELLGKKAQAKKCDAMAGILEEGSGIIEETEDGTATRDVGLILAAQKVEHYEIATYGGLAQLAATLGLDDVAAILQQTLGEEKAADEKLTMIAEEHVNYEAAEEVAA